MNTIWTYWHQGFDRVPYLVERCAMRMKDLHPEYTIRFLDSKSVTSFIDPIPISLNTWSKMSLPHRSDLIRTQLLIKHGGVWMDPTVFCMNSIDTWLPKNMNCGLLLFQQPGRDRIISNWFIAARKDNYLLKRLYQSLIEYWNHNDFRNLGSNNTSQIEYWTKRIINGRSLELSQLWLSPFFTKVLRLYPYMIYHYMFYRLIKKDPKCQAIYEAMPNFPSDGPVMVKRLGFDFEMDNKKILWLRNKNIPLFKLDWRIKMSRYKKDSLIHALLNNKINMND